MKFSISPLPLLLLLATAACEMNETPFVPSAPAVATGWSQAMHAWTPGPADSCTQEIHASYSVVGPDGLLYPTWHPPVDPGTGCTFGHEHGRDPRNSPLYREVGDIPFGYANSRLDIWDPSGRRHEDHVGHKVEWQSNVQLGFGGARGAVLDIRCEVLTKLHQGTHSADAFTNNLHELVYHISCNDGTRMHVTLMSAIGEPGVFVPTCDRDREVRAGAPTPLNSPRGGGQRILPDRSCVERILQQAQASGGRPNFGHLHESWETSNEIKREDGRQIAFFDPYYQVVLPSRYHDPSISGAVGRPLYLCLPENPFGGVHTTRGPCGESTSGGHHHSVTWDHPHSAFNGVHRFVDVNANRIANANGPEIWYTDPFGRNGRTEPFPGSIRQFIAAIDNTARVGHGPAIGKNRDYGGPGVRAPN